VSGVVGRPPPRRLWLTIPLYVVLLAVVVVDIWACVFWLSVGGSLGWTVGGAAALVVVVLTAMLLIDARRQWQLRRTTTDGRR